MEKKSKYFMWGGAIAFVAIVIGVGIFTGYKLYESSKVSEEDMDKTVYSTSSDSNQFAIYITGEGKFDGEGWPSADQYEFDTDNSYCIDSEGNTLKDVMTYEDEQIKFYTTSFQSCYVYFKTSKVTNLTQAYNKWEDIDTIIDSDGTDDIEDIWESTLTGDGYRYVGSDPDNYICFGTDNVDTCTSNPSKYMYRIIGIFADSSGNYHLKLIKMEALDTAYVWHSSVANTEWASSTLYTGINGSYYYTNSSYISSSTWRNMITNWTWTSTNTKTFSYNGTSYVYSTAGHDYVFSTTRAVYYHETQQTSLITDSCFSGASPRYNCTSADNYSCFNASCSAGVWKTVTNKIGLMYVSDYLLSSGSSVLTKTSASYASTFKAGWMHLSNNDSSAPSSYEWTIDRMGYFRVDIAYYMCIANGGSSSTCPTVTSGGSTMAEYSYSIGSTGWAVASGVQSVLSVRPVFYLNNSVTVIDGIGTIDDPYILEA